MGPGRGDCSTPGTVCGVLSLLHVFGGGGGPDLLGGSDNHLLYQPDSIRWILWISLHYAGAAVCREISTKKILYLAFSNLQVMFITIKSGLGIFLASF